MRQHGTVFKLSDVAVKKGVRKQLTLHGGDVEITSTYKDQTSHTESRGPALWPDGAPQDCVLWDIVSVSQREGGPVKSCQCTTRQ